jgi:hypothetical protein
MFVKSSLLLLLLLFVHTYEDLHSLMMNVFVADCKTLRSIQTQRSLLLLVWESFDAPHIPRITGSKEGVQQRVLITIPFVTHTHLYFGFFEHCKVALARVVTAAI